MNKLDSLFWIDKDILSERQLNYLIDSLTVHEDGSKYGYGKNQYKYYVDGKSHIGIPKHFYKDYDPESFVDERLDGNIWEGKREWSDKFELCSTKERNQVKFVRDLKAALDEDGLGVIGQASPGFGKTVCGVRIALDYGLKTIVIAHKEFLLKQWKRAFKKFAGIECGYVRGDKCDYKKYDVCLAMQKSLSVRDYGEDFYNNFSLKIWDEVHHVTADTFFKVDSLFPTQLTVGLTATPTSFNEKKTSMLFASVGNIKAKAKLVIEPASVFKINWNKNISRHLYEKYRNSKDISMSKLTGCIAEDNERNKKISHDVVSALKSDRKIIVLSDRVEHLEQLKDLTESNLKENNIKKKCGWFTGTIPDVTKKNGRRVMKEEEQDRNAEICDVLFATWQMTAEGLDIEKLDTLFMATPRSNIEQAVGRIQRPLKGKKKPFVIDYCEPLVKDLDSYERNRDKFYKISKFSVKDINIIPNQDQSWAIAKGY